MGHRQQKAFSFLANAAATLITKHPEAAVTLAQMLAAFFDHLATVADEDFQTERARALAADEWLAEQKKLAKKKARR